MTGGSSARSGYIVQELLSLAMSLELVLLFFFILLRVIFLVLQVVRLALKVFHVNRDFMEVIS